MLLSEYTKDKIEAGCDEAGRGCLAGPVMAAAVILPKDYRHELLNDSKQLTERQRYRLRADVEKDAICWAVASADNGWIDEHNILKASFHAMCEAVKKLTTQPEFLLIDGNRFYNETTLPYECFVKGDGRFLSIAAASILAKTYRDDYMKEAAQKYPEYGWDRNKGYPTKDHYAAIEKYGITPLHRKSFRLGRQTSLFEEED